MIPTISTIPLRHLASGDRLFLQVYQFKGASPGKKAYLQSNLHGAEISGNEVIHQLINFLQDLNASQLQGEIWLVPLCNPVGVNERSHQFSSGRYNPYDGKDWNRIFWDYEKTDEDIQAFAQSQIELEPLDIQNNYRQKILSKFRTIQEKIQASSFLAYSEYYRYQLQTLSLDADYLIDLHSSTNYGLDYLYCFHSREESAKAFLLDCGILMNDYDGDAFDEAFMKPWLALEKHLTALGKKVQFDIESWTLELGAGLEMNPNSVAKGIRGIKNYLATKAMLKIEGFPLPRTSSHPANLTPKTKMKTYYAPLGGMIKSKLPLGEFVYPDQELYKILTFSKTGELPHIVTVKANCKGLVFDVTRNHSVNQGDSILSILEQE